MLQLRIKAMTSAYFYSVEFVAYYLDRNSRMQKLRTQLQELLKTNGLYTVQQEEVQTKYDKLETDRNNLMSDNEQMLCTIRSLRQSILSVCPSKKLPPDPSTLLVQPQVVVVPLKKDTKKQKQRVKQVTQSTRNAAVNYYLLTSTNQLNAP